MKRHATILIAVSTLALTFVSGCTESALPYANETPAELAVRKSKEVYVLRAGAYDEGTGTVVYGRVKRTADNCCDTATGHVDLTLIDTDGMILDVCRIAHSPRNISKARGRSASFHTRLPYLLPEGTTLELIHHGESVEQCARMYAFGFRPLASSRDF